MTSGDGEAFENPTRVAKRLGLVNGANGKSQRWTWDALLDAATAAYWTNRTAPQRPVSTVDVRAAS